MRSRTVRRPWACCFATASAPPISSAWRRRSSIPSTSGFQLTAVAYRASFAGVWRQPVAGPPTPLPIIETLQGFQRTAALRAALALDLFTAIGEGANAAPALAQRCAASERGVRALCDYLSMLGFLAKRGDTYTLS